MSGVFTRNQTRVSEYPAQRADHYTMNSAQRASTQCADILLCATMINILTVSINTVHTLIQLVHYIPSQMIDDAMSDIKHNLTCRYLGVQSSCVVVVVSVAQPGQLGPQPCVLRLQLLHPLLVPPQGQVLPGRGVPRLHQLQDRLLHSLQPARVIPEHHRSHLEMFSQTIGGSLLL